MSTKKFVHLHTHTSYSVLDGAAKPFDLIEQAVELGQPAISSTDHGNMYAIPEMTKLCNKAGIKYIPGIEAYQARESISDRPKTNRKSSDDSDTGKLYHHLTLLGMNKVGYHNLIKLSSRSYLEGYYYKPRIDWDILSQHNDGLIATSSCLGGVILQEILKGNLQEARNVVSRFKDIFDDRFYIEVQNHGIPEQLSTNVELVKLSKEFNLPLVATNDLHYVKHSDHKHHDVLLCCQTGAQITDTNRFKFSSDQHYLKSADEMYSLFNDPMFKGACENTLEIADRCIYVPEMTSESFHLPKFPYDEDIYDSSMDYLRVLTFTGAKKRYGNTLSDEVRGRINYELDVIGSMGFADYFLITWDLVEYAKLNNVLVGYGRGSAGGCIISYCLGITNLCPIEYDLYFERFLNPSRISMPDIDIDIDTRFRDTLINHCAEKYGQENVCQIITMTKMGGRTAIKDVAKSLGHSFQVSSDITSKLPPLLMGKETPLWACLADEPPDKYASTWPLAKELRELYTGNKAVREICETALSLEGVTKTTGIHAGGVVVSDRELTEYLPIQKVTRKNGKEQRSVITTQYDLSVIEDLGLLKMDWLGLRNLDVVSMTIELLAKSGIEFNLDEIPLDDPKTYNLLQKGMGAGVFQVESREMQSLMMMIKPENIYDIAALISLYRPGPMAEGMHIEYANRKSGKNEIIYPHSDAEEILGITYGILTYQEQMMKIAEKFAGYSMAEADSLRKATGKKNKELMHQHEAKFKDGCVNKGYAKELANYWWRLIEPFADYSFNKSHAIGYGLLVYATAYLKANYPAQYMTALLNSIKDNITKAGPYIFEAQRLNVKVDSLDINKSETLFSTDGNEIRFALSAVKQVGEDVSGSIVAERDANGSYLDFNDFVKRLPLHTLRKDCIGNLIQCGAFDAMHPRKGLYESYENIISTIKGEKKKQEKGIVSLFGNDVSIIDELKISNSEYAEKEILRIERELSGCYMTKHPLENFIEYSKTAASHEIKDLEDIAPPKFTIIGVITAKAERLTKKGDTMATLTIADFSGTIELTVFSKAYAGMTGDIDEVVQVSGRINHNNDRVNIIADSVLNIENMAQTKIANISFLEIILKEEEITESNLNKLKESIKENRGDKEIVITVNNSSVNLGENFTISPTPSALSALRTIFNREDIF